MQAVIAFSVSQIPIPCCLTFCSQELKGLKTFPAVRICLPRPAKSFLPLSLCRSDATEVDWMSVIHRRWLALPSPPLLRYFCILERMTWTALHSKVV